MVGLHLVDQCLICVRPFPAADKQEDTSANSSSSKETGGGERKWWRKKSICCRAVQNVSFASVYFFPLCWLVVLFLY